MASSALASAYVQIIPKMDGLKDKLTSAMGSAGASGGDRFSSGFMGGIKDIAIGNMVANAVTSAVNTTVGAVKGAFTDAFNDYASYEQLIGGVETLFKESADVVEGYAANAYKTAGLSANAYMETVTSFSASLLQSLDGNTSEAASKANTAITDMSDNANKMGTQMQSIQNAYQGFAKQNYTMLDNLKLGYGGTKSEMERLLADAEKFSGIKYDISSYADIVDAIHIVQTEMGITGTTAKEAASTIEGSMNSAKAAWENFLTGLGDPNADMSRLTDNLVKSLMTAGENALPAFGRIFSNLGASIVDNLPTAMGDVRAYLVSALPETMQQPFERMADSLGGLFDTIGEKLAGIVDSGAGDKLVDMLGPVMELVANIADTLSTVLGPVIEFIGQAFTEVIIPVLDSIVEAMNTYVMPAVQALGQALGNLLSALSPILPVLEPIADVLVNVLGAGFSFVVNVISTVIDVIASIVGALTGFLGNVTSVGEGVASFGQGVASVFESLASGVISTVTSWWENVTGAVSGGVDSVISFVSNIPGSVMALFGDAGSWLVDSGKALIDGFAEGISSAFEAAKDMVADGLGAIRDFFPFSPAKEGPFSGKGWTLYSGMSLIEGFADGIKAMAPSARDAMRGVMGELSGIGANLSPSFAAYGAPAIATADYSGKTYNISINVNGGSSDEETGRVIAGQLLQALRMGA